MATNVVVGAETNIFGGEADDDESVLALKIGAGGTFELCSGARSSRRTNGGAPLALLHVSALVCTARSRPRHG